MGELVVFRPQKANEIRRQADAGASAEILFFMGVRILRIEKPEEPPKPKGRRRPQPSEPSRKRGDR